jgi:monothiol glutaredoxin
MNRKHQYLLVVRIIRQSRNLTMPLNNQVRSRIESLLSSNDIVLFMKGTPKQPQCGFSATVIGILGGIVPDYATVNVLEEPEIRDGIKEFSQWPTIPQLYVREEFVGGCDVIQQMYASGELHETLGFDAGEVSIPEITVSDSAAKAIKGAVGHTPGGVVHLKISATWNHEFSVNPAQGHEIAVTSNDVEILLDRDSAQRAQGLEIDLIESPQGGGFSIRNPNAPPPVVELEVEELKAKLEAGEAMEFLDVRDVNERAQASIAGTQLLDQAIADHIGSLPKDTMLVFHCHTGVRSQQAAEHFRGRGFTNVSNLVGGIDAWSQRVDSSVPRY